MWNDTIASSCSINNAQCVRLYNDCICHCLPGFVLVDGTCLKSKIAIMFSIRTSKGLLCFKHIEYHGEANIFIV